MRKKNKIVLEITGSARARKTLLKVVPKKVRGNGDQRTCIKDSWSKS